MEILGGRLQIAPLPKPTWQSLVLNFGNFFLQKYTFTKLHIGYLGFFGAHPTQPFPLYEGSYLVLTTLKTQKLWTYVQLTFTKTSQPIHLNLDPSGRPRQDTDTAPRATPTKNEKRGETKKRRQSERSLDTQLTSSHTSLGRLGVLGRFWGYKYQTSGVWMSRGLWFLSSFSFRVSGIKWEKIQGWKVGEVTLQTHVEVEDENLLVFFEKEM